MSTLFDLSGKVAVITGGSRGLGLAVTRGLAAAGAHVVIVARGEPLELMDVDFTFIPTDLESAGERAGLIERVVESAGAVDILFHCAGQQHRAPALDFPLENWSAILELHLTAAMDLSQQAARHMQPRGGGKIVLLSSIIGYQGGFTIPAYAAAKHGITGLVQALANEWAALGINVNGLAPGYFDIGIGQAVLQDPVRGPQVLARIPAGRAGQAADLMGAAIFLASSASDYVHGHTLVVDGGWLGR
ncbi:MAG TPA: SDR family oxidoreductase [Abditibacteriaceae bacterium]|nr:SDR family oxidoreductase [Abditibacteriaceae bacterium]